MSKSFRQLL